MKAVGYCRISKEDEANLSLDYQQHEIKRFCKRERISLVKIEIDNGISGKAIHNRPALKRVLHAIDNHEIDAVIVFKSDRLSRNGHETLQIEKRMRENGVAYLSITEGTLADDNLDSEFRSFIRAGLNQYERKLISLRTKQALKRKRERGERIGGRPRYGWKVVNGKMVKDVQEQQVIVQIKKLRNCDFSVRAIRDTLTDSGVCTRIGTAFSQSQIVRILQG
jgi:site-specific DNA recombinase